MGLQALPACYHPLGRSPVAKFSHHAFCFLLYILFLQALPAATIHSVVHVLQMFTRRIGRFQRWGPTMGGLAVVPFLPFMYVFSFFSI
jgi:hypothetical protein